MPVSFNKMDGFSTVDGFLEITECLAEMIKYLANEPSVGLFYVQQHTQSTVPNLVNLKNKVEDKSREMTLHTEDSEDSITVMRSMKECGFPIVNEMIKDIKKSLVIMSTKEPKKGLINNPSSRFQMGRTSSWVSTTWGREADLSQQDGERTSNYFTTVFKSAKERAGSLKWPQFDSTELKRSTSENLPIYHNPTLPFTVAHISSTMPSMEVEEFPPSQIANELQEDESQIDGSLVNDQLSSLSENFEAFRSDQEAKLEEWLKGTLDQDGHIGETNAEGH